MSNIIDIYPLSPLQEGMLFHSIYDQEDENSASYIVQISILLGGKLDTAIFKKAWEHVINRNEIFRSAFMWEEIDHPLQVVFGEASFEMDNEDWSTCSHDEREKRLKLLLESDRKKGFQLDEAQLMRVKVIKEAEAEYRIVWTHHHILLDGWSVSLVFKELFTIYLSMMKGEAWDLPKSPPYKKYIQWIKKQDKLKAEQYWKEELQGFTAPTPYTLERQNRSADKGYGESVQSLSVEETQALQVWVRKNKVTLNTLTQGVWSYLLSKYSGEQDVVFGVTSSGRPTEIVGVENMVGPFINTLPTRIQVSEDSKIVDWLLNIQEKEIERRQYEYTALTEIQGWSEVSREVPLFHTLYVFENYPAQKGNLDSDLEILNVHGVEQTNYPLNLVVIPGEQLSFKLMYDRSQFDEMTIDRIQGHLYHVLKQMTE
ncbi:Condensation domain-containing protein [Marininema mesophilum]|uniref:Condensation domain-containing protein n=1 Tax=Marininema mesophilum TaxID=1048340 RepID=A0A1H2YV27_9BACL|nr:Condensation domain-containing protein [Marininema mesophilum]